MKRFNVLKSLAALFVFSQIAWGAVPQLINFQGVLKTPADTVVSNGSYSVTFTIYDAATGGNVKWTETQSVTTADGLFAVLLGAMNSIPDTVFKGVNRWLGIAVAPDGEMPARQQLVSVGYSYRVNSVDAASGGTINGNVKLGTNDTLFASNVSSNSPLQLQTAGTTRMYFDDVSGRIGVGTTNPQDYLDVYGRVRARTRIDGFLAGFIVADAAGTFKGGLVLNGSAGPSIYADGQGYVVNVLNANGNVGIGTNSPSEKLEVNGNAKASNGHLIGTPAGSGYKIQSGSIPVVFSAEAIKGGDVTFPAAYTSPPIVVVSEYNASGQWIFFKLDAVSTTGFSWAGRHIDGTTITHSTNMSWIAIGN